MSSVFKPFILSAPTQGYSDLSFVYILLLLVAVAVPAWMGGLRLVRKKENSALVFVGVIVLVLALVISLLAFQLTVSLLGDL